MLYVRLPFLHGSTRNTTANENVDQAQMSWKKHRPPFYLLALNLSYLYDISRIAHSSIRHIFNQRSSDLLCSPQKPTGEKNPQPNSMQTTPENVFSKLSEDVVLKIFFNLEDDPRHWARLACVCTKFCSLMHTVCWITKCSQTIPTLVSDLLSTSASSTAPPGGWASLHKLAVCCPGLLHAGVLEHELGPKKNGQDSNFVQLGETKDLVSCDPTKIEGNCGNSNVSAFGSLYDDFCNGATEDKQPKITEVPPEEGDFPVCKRRKVCRSVRSHLASGVWNLSREQGNKLLASRFRGDCLYISDWPGCLHVEEKRNYMLFRGVFKNFKRSKVWRTISDGNRSKIDLNCAFCSCKQTWDLHSAFCLRQVFGYHDDGEQVVRAYVCENGHVSGAWTDWPLYT